MMAEQPALYRVNVCVCRAGEAPLGSVLLPDIGLRRKIHLSFSSPSPQTRRMRKRTSQKHSHNMSYTQQHALTQSKPLKL